MGRWGRGLRLHPLLRGSLLVLWGWLRVPLVLGGGGAVAPPPGASCTLLSVSAPAPGASALVLVAARLERSAPLSWPGCQLSALQPRTLCSPSSPLPPWPSCWSPSPPRAACFCFSLVTPLYYCTEHCCIARSRACTGLLITFDNSDAALGGIARALFSVGFVTLLSLRTAF